jgi:hypothetical protein
MGGARGVGNPVCPHEELATIVGKCWVIHAFKRWGRESPHEAARPRLVCALISRPSKGARSFFWLLVCANPSNPYALDIAMVARV